LADQGNILPLKYDYPVSEPWNYFDCDCCSIVDCPPNIACDMCAFITLSHPDVSKELAFSYIDTLVGYFIPRARVALNLNDTDCDIVGLDELSIIDASVYPNPSASNFNITVPDEIIQTIKVYDMRGSLIKEVTEINVNQYTLKGEEFDSGIYILNISTKNNNVGQKIIIK